MWHTSNIYIYTSMADTWLNQSGAADRGRWNAWALGTRLCQPRMSLMLLAPLVCSTTQADSERALRAVHSRFYLSSTPIGIGLVGPGLIGGALLDQVRTLGCRWPS